MVIVVIDDNILLINMAASDIRTDDHVFINPSVYACLEVEGKN